MLVVTTSTVPEEMDVEAIVESGKHISSLVPAGEWRPHLSVVFAQAGESAQLLRGCHVLYMCQRPVALCDQISVALSTVMHAPGSPPVIV